jgi:[ribosomal protein S5]-alanine N-acetyltransferase
MLTCPTLETERLILRRLELADAPSIQTLVSDKRIAMYSLSIPYPYPEGGALEFINSSHERTAQGVSIELALVLRAEHQVIGCVGLRPKPHKRSAEIGYWVGVPYWSHGYMTEAVRHVIQYAFDVMELNRIYATYLVSNPASGRVMQKAGMTHEGTMRQHVQKNGVFHDVAYYSILRSEYNQRKGE